MSSLLLKWQHLDVFSNYLNWLFRKNHDKNEFRGNQELDIREWGFVLGVIAIVVVALIWAAKWRRQRFDDIHPGEHEDTDDFPTGELPSGGARTVGYRDPTDIERMNDEIRARAEASKPRLSSFRPEPVEQGSLLLDGDIDEDDFDDDMENDVPLLLDPSEEHNQRSNQTVSEERAPEQSIKPSLQTSVDNEGTASNGSEVQELEFLANELKEDEPGFELCIDKEDQPERIKKAEAATAQSVTKSKPISKKVNKPAAKKQEASTEQEKPIDPGEIIIINLMTQAETPFEGEMLYKVVSELGLRHGDMKIFHYCGRHGDEAPQFRMANLVKPGYFDLEDIASTRTHALCFFFELMSDQDNMKIYEAMLSVINKIRDDMGGELHDENRSVFTIQTSEHCRNRIRDFQRKHLLKR